jgi:hypothetical protein
MPQREGLYDALAGIEEPKGARAATAGHEIR